MSHIAIDARELRTSTGRYIERLLHYLQQIDHTHNYTVLLKPKDIDSWQPSNSRFTKLACPYAEFGFGEQLGFKKQLDRLDADLVHFGMTQQPVRYKGRVVTTIHDLTTLRFSNPAKNRLAFSSKQRVYRQVVKRVARKSVAILTGSEFVKEDLAHFAHVNPAKITVTYEAADKIKQRPEPITGLEKQRFIMYVGRPTPHKNLERLIEAFVALKAHHPDLVLVLSGLKDANYERIESEVHRRTIKNVVFTGRVSEGRLRWLYENCSAYVFPSLSEGFGLPGLEAMKHGAPVVSSNATSLPEIYGQAAHYFSPLDIQAMADAINQVLSDKKLRQQLITAGQKQAKNYSWRRMAQQTLKVYNQALAE